MKRTIIGFILFVLVPALLAQTGTIRGIVQDASSNQALPAANVVLEDLKMGTTSDDQGLFILKNVPAGEHLLSVSYLGYRVYKQRITLSSGETLQLTVQLQPDVLPGQEVVVSATRARERETPVTFTNLSAREIQEKYTVQDIPMLLSDLPNVYAYADAGSPTGYTYLKVRGYDQSRVGVMINGIPLNDPEDHQVYWVDMPDFAESLEDIQLQRGVGSSVYGVATFGGSLNMMTVRNLQRPGAEAFVHYGSYRTRKYGAKINTNLINNTYQAQFRFSRILSDGYRENSGTDLLAYFATVNRYGEKSFTQLNVYGGLEVTHAAWEASPESALQENHRHNPITYPNTIDHFSQPHFELHHTYYLNSHLTLNNTLFYIYGNGYYETYKSHRNLWEYGLIPEDDGSHSDLIRQKWVEKNQFGWVGQAVWQHPMGELTLGTYLSAFRSDHWGEVKWVEADLPDFRPGMKYYQYFGEKSYLTAYANELFRPVQPLTVMVNLYAQHIRYDFHHGEAGNFSGPYRHRFRVDYNFFNPRFGLNYNLSGSWNTYANLSFAQREPADNELYDIWQGPDDLGVAPLFTRADTVYRNGRVDYICWHNPVVKPEKLWDYELGVGYRTRRFNAKVNLFYMSFRDEIVPYGQVDEDGFPIRGNAQETVHRGVEVSLRWHFTNHWEVSGNAALNDNYFKKFVMYDYDWNTGETIQRDFSGKTIAGFPDILGNLRLTYRHSHWNASLQLQHAGKQYLDNTENPDRIVPAFTLLNARVGIHLPSVWGLENIQLTIQLNNLLNKKYYTAGYYDAWEQENFYWPGAEFNWIAGLRWQM